MAVFRYFELREACRPGGKRNVAAAGRPLQAHTKTLYRPLSTQTLASPLANQQKPRHGAFFALVWLFMPALGRHVAKRDGIPMPLVDLLRLPRWHFRGSSAALAACPENNLCVLIPLLVLLGAHPPPVLCSPFGSQKTGGLFMTPGHDPARRARGRF